ncbi:MAG: DUF362 domain-containing protein [Thermodesulfobacteriota bacterium]
MKTNAAIDFPEMAVVEQSVASCRLEHKPADCLRAKIDALSLDGRFQAGQSVAVAVGSRRIDELDTVVIQCIRSLKDRGLCPFIVPAMGSHGGATPEGQQAVLAGYNITEITTGVPICAQMPTSRVSDSDSTMALYVADAALAADHIVLINRIKPHTKFKAPIESGLCKMLTIGLGKQDGATVFHQWAVRRSFGIIEEAAAALLGRLNVLFGVGLIEDGQGRLAQIEAVPPENLIEREKALLKTADALMGRIFLDALDILVIDAIGKDISGIGMDSNVTGRHRDIVGDFCRPPNPGRIFVRDLSPASDGNGNGIGLADVTTDRLVSRLDMEKTAVNAITAISPEKAAIPLHFETDRQCLAACMQTAGITSAMSARIVRIKHTAALQYIQVSKALAAEVEDQQRLCRISAWQPMAFDASDNLVDFYPHGSES